MEAPIESLTTLQNPSIDFDILELWIDDCSTSHGGIGSENFDYSSIMGMKTLKPERSRPLRDLKKSQICCSFYVLTKSEERSSKHEEPSSKPKERSSKPQEQSPKLYQMPSRPPQTISDSLEVAKRLDLDYLWVDRYYIDQKNEEEKKAHIGRLHHIFQKRISPLSQPRDLDQTMAFPE